MANVRDITKKIAPLAGVEEPQLLRYQRYLQEDGLVTKGAGRHAPDATPLDIARILIAASAINVKQVDVPEFVRFCGSLVAHEGQMLGPMPSVETDERFENVVAALIMWLPDNWRLLDRITDTKAYCIEISSESAILFAEGREILFMQSDWSRAFHELKAGAPLEEVFDQSASGGGEKPTSDPYAFEKVTRISFLSLRHIGMMSYQGEQ